jgi:hypothetical protein
MKFPSSLCRLAKLTGWALDNSNNLVCIVILYHEADRSLWHVFIMYSLWRACNLTAFTHTVSLVQWSTHLLPVMRDPGSIPKGVLIWNWDSPVSVFSLQVTCSCLATYVQGNYKCVSVIMLVSDYKVDMLHFNTMCRVTMYIAICFLINYVCRYVKTTQKPFERE